MIDERQADLKWSYPFLLKAHLLVRAKGQGLIAWLAADGGWRLREYRGCGIRSRISRGVLPDPKEAVPILG